MPSFTSDGPAISLPLLGSRFGSLSSLQAAPLNKNQTSSAVSERTHLHAILIDTCLSLRLDGRAANFALLCGKSFYFWLPMCHGIFWLLLAPFPSASWRPLLARLLVPPYVAFGDALPAFWPWLLSDPSRSSTYCLFAPDPVNPRYHGLCLKMRGATWHFGDATRLDYWRLLFYPFCNYTPFTLRWI